MSKFKTLLPGATIGIIGAGQLGKMLGQSAQKMGYHVAMLDPNPNACGFHVCHEKIVASFDDREALKKLNQISDVITFEFENIDGALVRELESTGHLPQRSEMLLKSQHRVSEKLWLRQHGLPTVDFVDLEDVSIEEAIEQIGLPAIIKSARFGYDGKGQLLLKELSDLTRYHDNISELIQAGAILEAYCPYEIEVSVMVVRDKYRQVEVFPVSENIHESGILAVGYVPSSLPMGIEHKIHRLAENFAERVDLIGLVGIELFVLKDGEILVNEIAPRPHNTGHYTIEGTNVSQYDQHILAITGRKIIPVEMVQATMMFNILGQHMALLPSVMESYPEGIYHLYDKGEPQTQRKMGHIIFQEDGMPSLRMKYDDDPFWKKWREMINEGGK